MTPRYGGLKGLKAATAFQIEAAADVLIPLAVSDAGQRTAALLDIAARLNRAPAAVLAQVVCAQLLALAQEGLPDLLEWVDENLEQTIDIPERRLWQLLDVSHRLRTRFATESEQESLAFRRGSLKH